MKKYENLKSRFQSISSTYKRPPENYNPLKYIRGSKLMDESFVNSNFPELNFSSNLKEWKDKEKSGKKGVLSYEEYLKKAKDERKNLEKVSEINQGNNNNVNNENLSSSYNRKSTGKFTYEDYKNQKGLNSQNTGGNKGIDFDKPTQNFKNECAKTNNNFFNNNNLAFGNINENKNIDPLNFSIPKNTAPIEDNPYEQISLDNLNLNSNNINNRISNNYQYNMGNPNFQGYQSNTMNNYNFNQGFPSNNFRNQNDINNQGYPSNNYKNQNNANDDFWNINSLSFPK